MAIPLEGPERKYEKGERRFKHVGKGPRPSIQYDESRPRRWIGKCPDNIPDVKKREILNEAVAAPNGDRDVEPLTEVGLDRCIKRLCTVYSVTRSVAAWKLEHRLSQRNIDVARQLEQVVPHR